MNSTDPLSFPADVSEAQKAKLRSSLSAFLSFMCVCLSLLMLVPLLSIVFLVLRNGILLLKPSLFTSLPPAAGSVGGGFGNAVIGTITMVSLALVIAAPIGILAAIYINEYDRGSRFSYAVRFVAKLLTGIPSIICGVFVFSILVTHLGFSAIAGSIALAILILPTILLTSEQALSGVPYSLREASTGLGATISQTTWCIVLPEALPAMTTGLMLAIARAAGETAPVLFTALFSHYWPKSLGHPTASLSVLIYNFSNIPYGHQVKLAWAASLVLVGIVTITSVTTQLLVRKR